MVVVDQRLGDELAIHDQLAMVVVAVHHFFHAQIATHADVGTATAGLARAEGSGDQQQGAGLAVGIHQRTAKAQVTLHAQPGNVLPGHGQPRKSGSDAAPVPARIPVEQKVAVQRQVALVHQHMFRGRQPGWGGERRGQGVDGAECEHRGPGVYRSMMRRANCSR